ncbi:MAG: CRTAC1 family protein, partial [Bdellovibrionia bacterium]
TRLGALNESRFGWGAASADLNNDGWLDIIQANGMVDDTIDKKYEKCPDYWYVNEKIARSAPSIHRYANRWGDIRGMCIYGNEKNRVYLNSGSGEGARFVDVADQTGFNEKTNSRGVAAVDLDNDGRLDLVVTHQFTAPSLFKNTATGPASNWIGIALEGDGRGCNTGAIGTVVKVADQMREAQVVNGFTAQSDMRVHFGLPRDLSEADVTVNWCGQTLKTYAKLKTARYHQLRMASGLLGKNE